MKRSLSFLLLLLSVSAATMQAQTWSPAGTLRYDAAEAFVLSDGRVFVPPTSFSTVYVGTQIWDPKTNLWTSLPAASAYRWESASVLLNDGRILVIGGQTAMNSAEIYNPTTNSWQLTAGTMAVGRYLHRAVKLLDGRVLITGGCSALGCATATVTAEIYDPVADKFTLTGSLSVARTLHTATLLNNGKVLVTGGYTSTGTGVTNVAELYDPATGAWTSARFMTATRSEHTATLLADGRVLVTGGSTDYGAVSRTADVYTPSTNKWSRAGAMTKVRYEHSAILLPSGKVLVAGGYSTTRYSYVVLAAAELYDPATGQFSATKAMAHPRLQFGLALLKDGRTIAVGGDGYLSGPGKYYPGDAETYR